MYEADNSLIKSIPWIRNAQFDGTFIFGLLGLAVATGIIIAVEPSLFLPIFVIDLWFLGFHHVVATFTRLSFDSKSFNEHKLLVVGLLPVVAGVTVLVAWWLGIWAVITIYFYWQWWHYTRQSWGVSRVYRAKDPDALYEDGWLDKAIFYGIPVAGILHRSSEQHTVFLSQEFWSLPVPGAVATGASYAAVALLVFWLGRRLDAARSGRLAAVHTLYMLSHFLIFGLAYFVTRDIVLGWLMINIWHNGQYILFVWMYNNRRFRAGIDPDARLLSYISQPGRLWLYLLTCIAITGIFYWGVLRTIDWLFFTGLSVTIVMYQVINFYHYLVDSMIWKVRKPQVRSTLGLAA